MIRSRGFCICKGLQVRRLTSVSQIRESNLTGHLFEKKLGNGSGPFIEIPEMEKLPRSSVLFKLPRNTTIHGNINNISLIDVSTASEVPTIEPLLRVVDNKTNLPRLESNSRAMNLVADTAVPTSHVQFIKLEDYTAGITLNANAGATVLYYNGEVRRTPIHENKHLKLTNVLGYGIIGFKSNIGPIQQIKLDKEDVITVFNNSLLGMERSCTVQHTEELKLKPQLNTNIITKGHYWLNRYYDVISSYWKPTSVDIKGPGIVLLQSMC
ncbi:hypothetical protein RNJ44_02750 [Nakaseomyces bracarensis]|uniref:Altered inheritance of mitochondria protein 24, mitochondrial n=1 Tax=Nakaseomyces bracarensis TaxID=273131 RepID=A0ABR4P036_9SACH